MTHFSPALMSINDFRAWAAIGRTKVYEEIGARRLPAVKVGRRTYIKMVDAEAWLAAQPAFLAEKG